MDNLQIGDLQSLDECCKSIKFHATNITKDISSTTINQGRIDSLRVLLDLFEQYNKMLIVKNGVT